MIFYVHACLECGVCKGNTQLRHTVRSWMISIVATLQFENVTAVFKNNTHMAIYIFTPWLKGCKSNGDIKVKNSNWELKF